MALHPDRERRTAIGRARAPPAGAPRQPVLRFAPSPNGELHLGHAYAALIAQDWADRLGGRLLVRIEDIDTVRCRPRYIDAALRDLAWLGLRWEQPVLRQSEHFAVYATYVERLRSMGLIYPCFATRAELRRSAGVRAGALDPDGVPLYPGIDKHLPPEEADQRIARGEPHAWRLDMDRAIEWVREQRSGKPLTFTEWDADGRATVIEARPQRWGDAILVRKDTPTSYHLSVVIDDARQGVTHVTRGRDLFAATDLHRLLQLLLSLPEPDYHHHPLLTDNAGRKLSKSDGDTALRILRDRGLKPEHLRQRLAQCRWST